MPSTTKSLAVVAASLWTLADSSPLAVSQALSRHLTRKRDVTEITCGLYSSSTGDYATEVYPDLRDKDIDVPVAAHSCNRIGCYTTSYVCNDQDVDITIPMSEISPTLLNLRDSCMWRDKDGSYDGGSGRITITDHGGYNVNFGYCDGNDGTDSNPAQYSDEWPGPNGTPSWQCGKPGSPPCGGAGCVEDTIVMEKQEPTQCGEYLASAYIGPGATYLYSKTEQVTETWTVGAFLSIDTSDLAPVSVQAGFFSSFSRATSGGTSTGVSMTCGDENAEGDFMCGLHVRPQCYTMSGYCQTEGTGQQPWAVTAPQSSSDGIGVFTAEICLCQNCKDTENPGAPDTTCGLECKGCTPNVDTSGGSGD